MGIDLESMVCGALLFSAAGMHTLYPIGYNIIAWTARLEQRNLARDFRLQEKYQVQSLDDLALHRVEIISDIMDHPMETRKYEKEAIMKVFREYLPEITTQSRDFWFEGRETKAFASFLRDERTKEWLTYPNYVISDKKYYWKTSWPGIIAHLFHVH